MDISEDGIDSFCTLICDYVTTRAPKLPCTVYVLQKPYFFEAYSELQAGIFKFDHRVCVSDEYSGPTTRYINICRIVFLFPTPYGSDWVMGCDRASGTTLDWVSKIAVRAREALSSTLLYSAKHEHERM